MAMLAALLNPIEDDAASNYTDARPNTTNLRGIAPLLNPSQDVDMVLDQNEPRHGIKRRRSLDSNSIASLLNPSQEPEVILQLTNLGTLPHKTNRISALLNPSKDDAQMVPCLATTPTVPSKLRQATSPSSSSAIDEEISNRIETRAEVPNEAEKPPSELQFAGTIFGLPQHDIEKPPADVDHSQSTTTTSIPQNEFDSKLKVVQYRHKTKRVKRQVERLRPALANQGPLTTEDVIVMVACQAMKERNRWPKEIQRVWKEHGSKSEIYAKYKLAWVAFQIVRRKANSRRAFAGQSELRHICEYLKTLSQEDQKTIVARLNRELMTYVDVVANVDRAFKRKKGYSAEEDICREDIVAGISSYRFVKISPKPTPVS